MTVNAANKINTYIDDLQSVINKYLELGSQSIAWIEMQISKILKKITDVLKVVKDKINSIIEQIETWYEKTITKIKISVIKGAMAKIGVSLTDTAAEGMSSMIPHPDIKTLIPEITIELEIPDITGMLSLPEIDIEKYLKKLPLL